MDAIVLAGGFARRMWPLTKDRPKHLLEVNGRPMLGYVLSALEDVEGLERVVISTNARFSANFESFLEGSDCQLDIKLVIEDTLSEKEKLGSIGAMAYIIEKERMNGDLLIIGGDNLFSLSLVDMHSFFNDHGDTIAVYDIESPERASLYGIVRFDHTGLITEFVEKPTDPPSTYAATACYMLTPTSVADIGEYVKLGSNADAMGNFISWLYRQRPVFAYPFRGHWFDVGSVEGLGDADRFYTRHGL